MARVGKGWGENDWEGEIARPYERGKRSRGDCGWGFRENERGVGKRGRGRGPTGCFGKRRMERKGGALQETVEEEEDVEEPDVERREGEVAAWRGWRRARGAD